MLQKEDFIETMMVNCKLKSFNDAYSEFFNHVKTTAIEECKINKYQGIVNMDVKYFVDENNFSFRQLITI